MTTNDDTTTHNADAPHIIAVPADQAATGADAGLIFGLYVGSAIAAAAGQQNDTSAALSDIADTVLRHNVYTAYTSGGAGLSMLVGTYLGRWCDLVSAYVPVCDTPDRQHGGTTVGRFIAVPGDGEAKITLRSREEILADWEGGPDSRSVDNVVWFGRLLKAKTDDDADTYGRMMHDRLGPVMTPAQGSESWETHREAATALCVFLHGVVTAAAMTFAELQHYA